MSCFFGGSYFLSYWFYDLNSNKFICQDRYRGSFLRCQVDVRRGEFSRVCRVSKCYDRKEILGYQWERKFLFILILVVVSDEVRRFLLVEVQVLFWRAGCIQGVLVWRWVQGGNSRFQFGVGWEGLELIRRLVFFVRYRSVDFILGALFT